MYGMARTERDHQCGISYQWSENLGPEMLGTD